MAHACYCWCGIVVRYPGWGIVVRYPGVVSLCVTLVRYPRGRGAKTFVYFLLLLTWCTKRTYLLKPMQARTGTTCMLGQGRVSAWTGAKLKIAFTPRPVAGS
jgi:hypothetical protein